MSDMHTETVEDGSELRDECDALTACFEAFERELMRISTIRASVVVTLGAEAGGPFKLSWCKRRDQQTLWVQHGEEALVPLKNARIAVRVAAAAYLPQLVWRVSDQTAAVIKELKEAQRLVAAVTHTLVKEDTK